LVLEALRAVVLARVVVISTMALDIMLVVHLFSVRLCVALRFLLVEEVLALGLDELVDLSTGEASEELLGKLMRDRLAY
jgi:hypothetical protein